VVHAKCNTAQFLKSTWRNSHDPTHTLIFAPQPEGGFTVTSPVLPELVTEGDTIDEAFANVPDALAAVLEIYSEQGRPLPVAT
jgi:predicted RNase H-like HicB family nuclease